MPKPDPSPVYLESNDKDLEYRIADHFAIVCKHCKTEGVTPTPKVLVHIEGPHRYSDVSVDRGSMTLSCTQCKRSIIVDTGC